MIRTLVYLTPALIIFLVLLLPREVFIVPLWEKNPALAVRRFNINFKYLIKKR